MFRFTFADYNEKLNTMNNEKPILVIVIPTTYFDLFKVEVQKKWSSHSIYFLVNHGVSFGFDYPENIKSLSFPYISELSWKTCQDVGFVWHLKNEQVVKTDYANSFILKKAEKIVYMCTSISISTAIAFETLINQNFKENREKFYLLYNSEGMSQQDIQFALKNTDTTDHYLFQDGLRRDMAKRFFEYNFNFNSCIIFRSALRKAGVLNDEFVFTKFVLSLFSALEGRSNFSTYQIVDMMNYWKGTGLYPEAFSPYIGTMIDNLHNCGLIKDNGNGTGEDKHYDFTEEGKRLFELIHPDCKDIDIPCRLLLWQENWPESKTEMVEYLITFFKKQMEFVS